jgi:hypothetical protein
MHALLFGRYPSLQGATLDGYIGVFATTDLGNGTSGRTKMGGTNLHDYWEKRGDVGGV